MVLQPFMPTCLLAATRDASVPMSAEESFSTLTDRRMSGMKGWVYLAGAPPGTELRVRPSPAKAAGEAMRKSAAAAPAALEERELRGEDAGNGRDGSVSFGDHFRTELSVRSISGLFIYPLFPGSKDDENGARLGPRSSPSPIRSRDLSIVDTGCRIGRRDRRRASIASRASPTRARWGREKHARFSRFRDFPEICRRDGPATYADFCSLAAALVALTWATARTVVLAATANIFLRDDEVGCVNGVDNRKPEEEESRQGRVGKLALGQSDASMNGP